MRFAVLTNGNDRFFIRKFLAFYWNIPVSYTHLILQGKQIFLILVTSVVLTGLLILLLLKKIPGRFLPWMVGVVAAGGIGNLIDRIFRGFVVDLSLIHI